MITNVSAAVVDLKAGTYTSNDGHTIIVNADKTISYEGTYALTLNEKDRGSTVTGKIGQYKVLLIYNSLFIICRSFKRKCIFI